MGFWALVCACALSSPLSLFLPPPLSVSLSAGLRADILPSRLGKKTMRLSGQPGFGGKPTPDMRQPLNTTNSSAPGWGQSYKPPCTHKQRLSPPNTSGLNVCALNVHALTNSHGALHACIHMFTYVYICLHMFTYVYICVYICLHMFIHMFTSEPGSLYSCMRHLRCESACQRGNTRQHKGNTHKTSY